MNNSFRILQSKLFLSILFNVLRRQLFKEFLPEVIQEMYSRNKQNYAKEFINFYWN